MGVMAVVVVLVAAGCSGSSGGRRSLTVGALYPTSGAQGQEGAEELRGVQLAAEWANAHGGVGGRDIRLTTVDAPRAEAVPSAMAALKRSGISVVVGSHSSIVSQTAAQVATSDGMVLFETGAVGQTSVHTEGGRHFFRMAPMGANLGTAAIDFVGDQLLPTLGATPPLRVAVAYVDDAYGRAVADGAAAEVGRKGQVLAGSVPYDSHTTDFAPIVDRIADARPDVLFVSAYVDDGVALRRATVAAGVHLKASIGTSSSYCMPAFGERLGVDAVGLFASDKPDAADVRADALLPEGRAMLAWASDQYRRRFSADMTAPALSGFSNASAVFGHILPAAGGTDRAAVAAAALRVKLAEGTLANGGGLDLAPPDAPDGGENRRAASVIWEWIAPGRSAVVWPPAFATHPLVPLPITP
jgi:ABC-type branched-subunit amino acid transport system substrate-binding protein